MDDESEDIIAERNKERWMLLKKISYLQRLAAREKSMNDTENQKGQNWDYRSCLKLEMLLMVTNHKNCLSVPHYLFPRELTRISVWIKSSLLYL